MSSLRNSPGIEVVSLFAKYDELGERDKGQSFHSERSEESKMSI